MVKELTSKDEAKMLRKIEGMISDKLLAVHNAGSNSLDYGKISEQLSSPHPEDIDNAIEDLIAQALIHSPDGEITT